MIGYKVIADIRRAREAFRRDTGREPNTLYLGRHEVHALEQWMYALGMHKGDPDGQDYFDGIPMFKVKDDSHLAVAYVHRVGK